MYGSGDGSVMMGGYGVGSWCYGCGGTPLTVCFPP